MLEEVATPENWKNKSTAFSCIAAAFGVLVTTGIIKLIEGAGTLSYSSIIIYSADTKLSDLAWTYKDAVGFTVVTVLAGLSAGAVTRAGLALNKYRAAARWRRSAEAKIAEAGVVAALTVLVCCLMPLTGSCKPYINEHDYGDLGYGDDHSQEGEGADDHHFRRLDGGGEHYYNSIASLSLVGEEGAIRHLLARDEVWQFEPGSLVIFLALYVPCIVAAFGLAVPAGTFVPLMLLGGASA